MSGERLPTPEPAAVLAEARSARPYLRAADLYVSSAGLALRAAHFARLPYLASSAFYNFRSKSHSESATHYLNAPFYPTAPDTTIESIIDSESNPSYGLTLSLNLDLFNGLSTDARVAGARATLLRARETRDALVRNLASEVRQTVLGYQEATEREALARRTLESASENLNLVQQKYNVGSATILDLIDSQVQLQRAQSDLVTALAAIRVAEAALERVRGHGE